MVKFLTALAQAKDVVDVNIAAGLALERLEWASGGPVPQPKPEAKQE